MKNITRFLVIGGLIVGFLFINISSVKAESAVSVMPGAGCRTGDLYNRFTGERCPSNPTVSCQTGDKYNSQTGKLCPVLSKVVISGVSGPQTLNVDQTGTWEVSAYDQNGGDLSYAVVWGDEVPSVCTSSGCSRPLVAVAPSYKQSATFTHAYSKAGTYKPTFYVKNSQGQSAQTSLSVKVGSCDTWAFDPTTGVPCPQTPVFIKNISPASGVTGSLVTLSGSGFTKTGNRVIFGDVMGKSGQPYNTLSSTNGTTLQFKVPKYSEYTGLAVQAGTYPVSVKNAKGESNAVNFQVTSKTETSNTIKIRPVNREKQYAAGQNNVALAEFKISADAYNSADIEFEDMNFLGFMADANGNYDPSTGSYPSHFKNFELQIIGGETVLGTVNEYGFVHFPDFSLTLQPGEMYTLWLVADVFPEVSSATYKFAISGYSYNGSATVDYLPSGLTYSGADSPVKILGNVTPASITVLSPNGGESWTIGTDQTIRWSPRMAVSYDQPVDIFLEENGCSAPLGSNLGCPLGYAVYTIAEDVYGSYSKENNGWIWQVGKVMGSTAVRKGFYNIKVCRAGTDVCDTSDSYFKIVESSSTEPVLLGDVDADGKVTCSDNQMILDSVARKITLTPEQKSRADMNNNGRVTAYDSYLLLAEYKLSCALSAPTTVMGAENFNFVSRLARGSSGEEVMELQKFLQEAGYYSGALDGKFGGQTVSALMHFQKANGLKEDGIVGAQVRALLNK